MTAMLDVQRQPFPTGQETQDMQEHDPYTYENEDSGRLTSAPSPEVPYGMVVSDPVPTHVAHWGTQQPQSFTGYVQDYTIVPSYEPPPKKQRTERRRERLNYTRYQLEILQFIYRYIRYPNNTQKALIGKRVGISRHQAKIWFQNRRRKDVTNAAPADTPEEKSMVPDAVKKGVLNELLKHKEDTPVKTTFRASPRRPAEQGRSSPLDTQRMSTASPDVLLGSDSNASFSSQPHSGPGQHVLHADVYSDTHSDPGSPYSATSAGGVASGRHSTDQGIYSDSPSNPGSPYSHFSISPTSAFRPKQKDPNCHTDPDRNHGRLASATEMHKETFFAYNDGSYYYPGATPNSIPAPTFQGAPPSFTDQMQTHPNQLPTSPSDPEKSQSPKNQSPPTTQGQPQTYLPGYQELMNYKHEPEVSNQHSPSVLEAQSDDLVSHRSHSNSETGSEHGEPPEATGQLHHIPPMAHQPPAFNVNRVFPFPFYAEPPMALSSMPNHHYQYHPWAYQPQAIQAAPNPFYGHYQDLRVDQPHHEPRITGNNLSPICSPPEAIKEPL